MEKGMDRNLRPALNRSASWRTWIRAAGLGLAVAGAGIALGTVTPAPALAQVSGSSMSVPLAPDAPSQYVVKKGDTLWDIAGVFLRDPWYWPEIWYVNPDIANPHLIYPGDVLNLVYVDGKPRITVGSAGATRLSPQVRSSPLTDAVRSIPYDLLMTFVGRPSLLDKDTFRNQPYVIGFRHDHMVGAEHGEVYGLGLGTPAEGARYNFVHVGDELIDPDDGDLLGYIGHYSGTGRVIQTTSANRKEPITHLQVLEMGREIMQGDKIFAAEVDIGDDFVPSAPAKTDIDGRIVAVVDGVYAAGRFQVLAINRGKRHGLVPGNALAVFGRGEVVTDRPGAGPWRRASSTYATVQLPKERNGTLLLFRVYDRMSYGLVVESIHAIREGDYLKHPAFGHRDTGLSDFAR